MNSGRLALAFTVLLSHAGVAADNELARLLIEQGVQFSTGQTVRLPEPTMSDGLDAAAQGAVLTKVAARYPMDQFVRESPVAPFAQKMEPIHDDRGKRVGQRLDVWFVAHGRIAALLNKSLLEDLVAVGKPGSTSGMHPERFTPAELAQRGLTLVKQPDCEEDLVRFSVPIMDRVQLSGISRQMTSHDEETIVAASVIDPRFAADQELSNQWRPLERSPDGQLSPGKPHAYCGNGQYVKATVLRDPDGRPIARLFIEAHLVFHEPQAWFGGANLLGSKLPLAVQESVRGFRRALKQAEVKPR